VVETETKSAKLFQSGGGVVMSGSTSKAIGRPAEAIEITEEMVYAGTRAILNVLDVECAHGLSVLLAESAAREVLRCALLARQGKFDFAALRERTF
jgi:hypothetical protein